MKLFNEEVITTPKDFDRVIKMLPDYYTYRIKHAWYPKRRYVAVGSAIVESGWYYRRDVLEVKLRPTHENKKWVGYKNIWRAFESYNDS